MYSCLSEKQNLLAWRQ